MRIAIGSDHRGFRLKQTLMQHVAAAGHVVADFGCYDENAVDFTDVAIPLSQAVAGGEEDLGILICSNGVGMTSAPTRSRAFAPPSATTPSAPARPPAHQRQRPLPRLLVHRRGRGARDRRRVPRRRVRGRASQPASGEAPGARSELESVDLTRGGTRRPAVRAADRDAALQPLLDRYGAPHRGRVATRLRRPRPRPLQPHALSPRLGGPRRHALRTPDTASSCARSSASPAAKPSAATSKRALPAGRRRRAPAQLQPHPRRHRGRQPAAPRPRHRLARLGRRRRP